jgi:hypothetical protein
MVEPPAADKHRPRPPVEPSPHDFDSQPLPMQLCFRGFEERDAFLVVLSIDRQAVVSDRVKL